MSGLSSKVSIILPTFNRARFLPQAFDAILGQIWTDWELIVVDDGSTDETSMLVEEFRAKACRPVSYILQENQGPYGARNTGLDRATGAYIAFYDSDDVWLPHHLSDCLTGLESHPEVDWVYGACRMVEYGTRRELSPNSFYVNGRPRPFLRLETRTAGPVRIIDDRDALRCAIHDGFFCGLQNSVIRSSVFSKYRFTAYSRNEAEDRLIVAHALAAGHRFGYIDRIHVQYHIHEQNSSAAGASGVEKRIRIHRSLIEGLEKLGTELKLSGRERRAWRRRLGQECFWNLGYAILWQHGRRREAMRTLRRGLSWWPWNWRFWKTYLIAQLRTWWRPDSSQESVHTCVSSISPTLPS
jgi:glycosyltransferase involved in cell wall biosynthesis